MMYTSAFRTTRNFPPGMVSHSQEEHYDDW